MIFKNFSSVSSSGAEWPETVPVVSSHQIQQTEEFSKGSVCVTLKARLILPGGDDVPVVIKYVRPELHGTPLMFPDLRKEAIILQKLDGVEGVPKVYGVTNTFPDALVMSMCDGEPLEKWWVLKDARTYLTVLMHTCKIISRIHEKGVIHCDLHDNNILVKTAKNGDVESVSIIDFGQAEIESRSRNKKTDAKKISLNAMAVLREVTQTSDPDLYSRRLQFFRLTKKYITVEQVSMVLCSILHSHTEDPRCDFLVALPGAHTMSCPE